MFSKKATKINEIFTVDLTCTTLCQIESEDFIDFCGLLRKHELFQINLISYLEKICTYKIGNLTLFAASSAASFSRITFSGIELEKPNPDHV